MGYKVGQYIIASSKSKVSGKEEAKDVPSWARWKEPYVGERGNDFTRHLLDEKYDPGN